MRARVTVG